MQPAERLDGAVIDINLRSQMSYLMANVLEGRDVPFVFTTGYDSRTAISVVGSGHRSAIGSRQANVGQNSIQG